MRFVCRAVGTFLLFTAVLVAHAQDGAGSTRDYAKPMDRSGVSSRSVSDVLTCSPAPCVLPAVQPSDGGFVANAPIVANPLNPKELLLGSQNNNCPYPSFLGFYVSNDGGSTWNLSCMVSFAFKNHDYDPDYNAMVGYDRKGTAFVAGFYLIEDDVSSFGFVAFQRSSDGGRTWSSPAPALGRADSIPDGTWLTVDTGVSSPYVNTIYISGVLDGPLSNITKNQVVVSHSNDGGANWKQVPVAPVQNYPENDLETNIAVGKDGTVYVTWMYCNTGPFRCNDLKGYMLFSKSGDGGNTWSKPKLMETVTLLSTPLPNTDVGVTNIPVIGVDNSNGPNAGSLYVTAWSWTGTFMRVGVIHSTDGGNTWSKPVPVAPADDTHDQFFPWLSVSPTGLVGVSWLDRRNDPANIDYQAFAAISTNGGLSFRPNVQLTTSFSNPNNNGSGNNWMGNYTGNTWAGPDFVAAWMDTSNGSTTQDVVGGIRLK